MCRDLGRLHLYYLHILLLVYALLPLTRAFVRAASETELRYALALWFALGIVFPTLRAYWPFTLLTDIPLQWMLNMSWAAVGYGLLGWYLTRRPLRPAVAWPLALAGFALVFFPTALCSLRAGALEERFLEGMSVGVCLLAAGLFSLLYPAGRDMKPGKGRAFVTAVSRASFCIFLVHVLWLEVFAHFGLTAAAEGMFTPGTYNEELHRYAEEHGLPVYGPVDITDRSNGTDVVNFFDSVWSEGKVEEPAKDF